MATRSNRLVPARAIHPGEILREELQERGIKQKNFAQAIGVQATHLNEFIKGKRNLNEDLAMKLESQLGIPFKTWMNLHNGYMYELIRIRDMEKRKNEALTDCSNLDEISDVDFRKVVTPSGDNFDKETEAFCLAQTLREERIRAGLTQQQLAEKIGTKKTYISQLENGKADVRLSTLFKIFEGLGRRVSLSIL